MNRPYPPCMAEGPREPDGMGTSCMKWYGHKGPHDFVCNDWIFEKFRNAEEKKDEN